MTEKDMEMCFGFCFRRRDKMKNKESCERIIFYTAAAAGGIFAGYTVAFAGILGTAQTSNLIEIIDRLIEGDYAQLLICLGAVGVYAAAIVLTRIIKSFSRADIRLTSLAVSAAAAAAMAFMPEDTEPMMALYPCFFAMAFQWNSFPGAYGYASACIFSSNNFRQMTDGAAEFFCTGDREAGRRSLFYAGTLLFFHIGAASSLVCWRILSQRAMLICLPVLAAAAVMIALQRKMETE